MSDKREEHQVLIYLNKVVNATIAEMEKATGLDRQIIKIALNELMKARSVRREIEGLCSVYSIIH